MSSKRGSTVYAKLSPNIIFIKIFLTHNNYAIDNLWLSFAMVLC